MLMEKLLKHVDNTWFNTDNAVYYCFNGPKCKFKILQYDI